MFNFSIRKGEVIVDTVTAQRLGRDLYRLHIDTVSKYPELDNCGVDDKGQPYFYFIASYDDVTGEPITIKTDRRLKGQTTLVTIKLPGYVVLGTKYSKYGYDVIIKKDFKREPKTFRPKRVRC